MADAESTPLVHGNALTVTGYDKYESPERVGDIESDRGSQRDRETERQREREREIEPDHLVIRIHCITVASAVAVVELGS